MTVEVAVVQAEVSPTLDAGLEGNVNVRDASSIDGAPVLHNTAQAVNAGSHNVSEDGLPGYEAGSWGGDCAADGSITLVPGQNASCTITNDDQPSTLTLVKTVTNDDGGSATAADFQARIDGGDVAWQVAVPLDIMGL